MASNTGECDFGWHKDHLAGSFRVSFRGTTDNGEVYAHLAAAGRDEVLVTGVSLDAVRKVLDGWADGPRDLTYFKARVSDL